MPIREYVAKEGKVESYHGRLFKFSKATEGHDSEGEFISWRSYTKGIEILRENGNEVPIIFGKNLAGNPNYKAEINRYIEGDVEYTERVPFFSQSVANKFSGQLSMEIEHSEIMQKIRKETSINKNITQRRIKEDLKLDLGRLFDFKEIFRQAGAEGRNPEAIRLFTVTIGIRKLEGKLEDEVIQEFYDILGRVNRQMPMQLLARSV